MLKTKLGLPYSVAPEPHGKSLPPPSLPSPALLTLSFSLGALKAKSTSKGSEATAAERQCERAGGRVFTYTFARNMCLTREGESEENDHAPRSSVVFDFSDRSYVPLFERSCKCSESGVALYVLSKSTYRQVFLGVHKLQIKLAGSRN